MNMTTATPNPYLMAATEGLSAVTDIIGLIMQKSAMDEAKEEARALDRRETAYRASRDVVEDRFSKETLKIYEEKNALNKALAMHGLNVDKIARVENMFNTNTALRDRKIKLWGGR